MTKYLSMYKVRQETVYCTFLCNILYKINDFPIAKTKAILPLAKLISKEKSPYIDALDRKNLTGINKKMSNRNKAAKISKVNFITLENKNITLTQSRSEI